MRRTCSELFVGRVDLNKSLALTIGLLLASSSAKAGYLVDSQVTAAGGTNFYTWTVSNLDQSWGLDGFAIEVPAETRILARSVPPPYSNPDRTARWIMEERFEAQVDGHDGRVNVPAPRPGMKILLWWGVESPSVYPPGTSVSFSIATDTRVTPGVVRTSASTYTPQNNPHWYVVWFGQVLGPSISAADTPTLHTAGVKTELPSLRSVLTTNQEDSVVSADSRLTPLPAVAIALHAGISVEGLVGHHYGIQYSTNISDPGGWHGLANVMLTTPKQVWYDSRPASGPQCYYRVVPGPIPVP